MSGEVVSLPDWLPIQPWCDWLEMREKHRWKLTERAKRMWLADLEEWRVQGYDVAYILNEATKKSWRGLFVNDRTPRLQPKAQFTSPERAQEILDMIERQRAAARVH